MQPGDILLVQLDAGPRLSRYIETKGNRLRLAIGRNREARLPPSRLIHETGLNSAGFGGVEELTQQAEAVATDLDLEEVWDIVCDDGVSLTLIDIGELYWGSEPTPEQTVGLLLNLLRDDLRFVRDGVHFLPRDRDTVSATIERIELQVQRAADMDQLSGAMRSGTLPTTLTERQVETLGQVRAFVVHGDDYPRSNQVKSFLDTVGVRGRDQQRAAFDTLVALGVMVPDEHLALERAEIKPDFPEHVLAEARSIHEGPLLAEADRVDLTELRTFTVDNAETRDRDDALSIESMGGGSHRVWVHITDAGALIPRSSSVDAEADRRMSSLYLPQQTISMMPSAVSAGSGSLNPGQVRAAASLVIDFNPEAEVVKWEVIQSVILSDRALSYQEADDSISDQSHDLQQEIAALSRIATLLRTRREAKGALSIDQDELSVKVDQAGGIAVDVIPRRAPARSLVEEFMVLCNSILAIYCVEHNLPAPFRSQSVPDVSDISAQTPDGPLRKYLITRRLTAATVSTKPGAHGGLGVDAYTQATSPLRRYPDLVVQRQISHHLRRGEALYDDESMVSVAHRADVQVRQMGRIENNRRQYFFLKWLDGHRRCAEERGDERLYQAMVLDRPPNRAAILELVEWPFRTRAAVPNSVSAGETVALRLHGVDLWRRTAQFTIA